MKTPPPIAQFPSSGNRVCVEFNHRRLAVRPITTKRAVRVNFQPNNQNNPDPSQSPHTTPSTNPIDQLRIDFNLITSALSGLTTISSGATTTDQQQLPASTTTLQPSSKTSTTELQITVKQQEAEIHALKEALAEKDAKLRASKIDVMESKAAVRHLENQLTETKNQLQIMSTESSSLRQRLSESEMALEIAVSDLETLADEVLQLTSAVPEPLVLSSTDSASTTTSNITCSDDDGSIDINSTLQDSTKNTNDSAVYDELLHQIGLFTKRIRKP